MIELLALVLGISFVLALLSLRDYKGHSQYRKISSELHKERIKGTIVLPQDGSKVGKHYSSYS